MKNLFYLSILFLSIIVQSCSSDDSNNDNGNDQIPASLYFPLAANSYWTYSNVSEQGNTNDSLYVKGVQNQNSNTYTDLDARMPVTAFMNSLLSQNLVRANESKFVLFGELGTPPVDGFPNISIPLNDVILFDTEAVSSTLLTSFDGEIEQEINGFPIVIDYMVRTEQREKLSNYSVGGQAFNDVIKSVIILNLAIIAEIEILPGVELQVQILATQDVLIVTNYYAANTGLIYSDALTQYELEDLSQFDIELPFPGEASSTATQSIDVFSIGN